MLKQPKHLGRFTLELEDELGVKIRKAAEAKKWDLTTWWEEAARAKLAK